MLRGRGRFRRMRLVFEGGGAAENLPDQGLRLFQQPLGLLLQRAAARGAGLGDPGLLSGDGVADLLPGQSLQEGRPGRPGPQACRSARS